MKIIKAVFLSTSPLRFLVDIIGILLIGVNTIFLRSVPLTELGFTIGIILSFIFLLPTILHILGISVGLVLMARREMNNEKN